MLHIVTSAPMGKFWMLPIGTSACESVNHDILMSKFSIMASGVSFWASLSLIWEIGNNMSQSKNPDPLCQTLH